MIKTLIKTLMVSVFLAASAPLAFAQTADDIHLAKAQLWAAQDAYAAGNYKEALSKVEDAEKTMGAAGAQTLLLKAKSLYKLGQYEDAKRAASQFYGFNPAESLKREMAPILIDINEKAAAELIESKRKLIWDKTYGGSDWDSIYSIALTPDGGALLGGDTKSKGAGDGDMYLVKIGNIGP